MISEERTFPRTFGEGYQPLSRTPCNLIAYGLTTQKPYTLYSLSLNP
jgi:hypothetical protein